MRKKKKQTPTRIQPPKQASLSSVNLEVPPLHISFPITLHHKTENKLCFFRDEIDMKKYIERCKLKETDYKVTQTTPR